MVRAGIKHTDGNVLSLTACVWLVRLARPDSFHLCKLFAAPSHMQVSVLGTVVHYSHGTSLLTQAEKRKVTHHDGGDDGKHCITERLQPFRTKHMLTQRHVESFCTIKSARRKDYMPCD